MLPSSFTRLREEKPSATSGQGPQMAVRGAPERFALAVLGCTGVGKSALAGRFLRDEVLLEHDPTIEDLHRKELVLKGAPVCLEIVDTAGQETYTSLRRSWLQNGKGFLFVFSLADRQTLDGLSAFREEIRSVYPQEAPPSVIAANMADLQWDVSEEDLKKLQANWPNCVQVLQTSAVTGQNVHEAFEQLSSAVQEREHRLRRAQREAALQLSSNQESTQNCARCRLAQCFASCTVQ
ncbi:H-RAS [Symbiodinium sp. CCMP2456]|nr:H-RAS [Symbiodinium sp. CCMP2456]